MKKENEELNIVEVIENEEKENIELVETKSKLISKEIDTTIKDKKFLFNLNDSVDYKLNDKENAEILVKDILIKTYIKEATDEKTGEIIYDEKTGEVKTVKSIVTVFVDENKKSYVTASKFFANRVKELMECYETKEELLADLEKGIKIKIVKKEMPDDKNKKYLTFEWI